MKIWGGGLDRVGTGLGSETPGERSVLVHPLTHRRWAPPYLCPLAVCLPCRPRSEIHLSLHPGPGTDGGGEGRRSTLSVPFYTGRQDEPPCLYFANGREKHHNPAWSNSLWEGIGETAQHVFCELPASKL